MFEKLLKEKKLKLTNQIIFILEEIEKKGHLSIKEISTLIKKNFKNISNKTLYNTINLLLEYNILESVAISRNETVYEIKKDKHSHFKCLKCDSIYDINIPKNSFNINSNYKIKNINIILEGECQNCI